MAEPAGPNQPSPSVCTAPTIRAVPCSVLRLHTDALPTLPNTEAWVNEILSLPIHGELPLEDVDRVCDAVEAYLDGAA